MVQSKRLMKKVAAFQLSPGVAPCWEVYQKEEMAPLPALVLRCSSSE